MTTLSDNSRSVEAFLFPAPYFTTNLGNNNKSVQAYKMDDEYSTRSIFLESVAVDNFMETRLDKMVVIRMESRQSESSVHETNQTDSSPYKKKNILEY